MIDLMFIIIAGIIGLILGEVIFLFIRYFTFKRQGEYESKIDDLTRQVDDGKLSQLLFRRMQEDLRKKYHVQFFQRWWGGE